MGTCARATKNGRKKIVRSDENGERGVDVTGAEKLIGGSFSRGRVYF